VVEAAGGSVRAVGTQFAVRVRDRALSVLVIEGVVAVDAASTQAPAAPASPAPRLVAGQKLDRAGATSAIAVLPAAEVERSLAWRAGMLQFDGQPLALAVDEVARYTGARFVVEDPEIRKIRVWAYFRAADLNGFLSGLEQNIPTLTVRREDGVVYVTRREDAATQ
jgi:transmembrane sensor